MERISVCLHQDFTPLGSRAAHPLPGGNECNPDAAGYPHPWERGPLARFLMPNVNEWNPRNASDLTMPYGNLTATGWQLLACTVRVPK